MLVALCLISGLAALGAMSSVLAVLVLGLGLAGLLAAAGCGVVSLVAGLWAAALAFAPRPVAILPAA